MNYRLALNTLLVLSLFMGYAIQLSAQSSCDSSLQQVANNPLSYHTIDNRCEGVFIQPVGSTSLQVVSFTESFEEYDLNSAQPLEVSWGDPPGDSAVRLRAQGVKRKLYYRMDSYNPPDRRSFSWPVNILASLNISRNDIGVIALTKDSIRGAQRDIYVPVRIRQVNTGDRNSNYKLALLPGVEFSEIYISLAQLAEDGRSEKIIKDRERLGYGYYPADRTIEIPLTGSKGVYNMRIEGILRTGGTTTIEAWLYIPG